MPRVGRESVSLRVEPKFAYAVDLPQRAKFACPLSKP
jgi:hypothetical protein